MKQITLSISDEKYALFLEMIQALDYVHLEENTYHVSEEQMKYVLDIKAKNSIALSGNPIKNDDLEKYVSESLKSGSISMEDFKKNRY
jgi:hypothetical protein